MVYKSIHQLRSNCPLAEGLDLVGDHWSLLIVRDLLLLGLHEYRQILQNNEGISSNVLSDRLAKLQQAQILKSLPHPDNKRRKLYYLTQKGKDLLPVLIALAQWTLKHSEKENHRAIDIKTAQAELAEWERLYGIV